MNLQVGKLQNCELVNLCVWLQFIQNSVTLIYTSSEPFLTQALSQGVRVGVKQMCC